MRIASCCFAFLLGWCVDQKWERAAAADRRAPACPVKLEAGKPVLGKGEQLIVPKGTVIEVRGKALAEVDVSSLRLIPALKDQWVYEIRPLGRNYLRVEVAKGALTWAEVMSTGAMSKLVRDTTLTDHAGITWLEQPYEIRDRAGKVVFKAEGTSGPLRASGACSVRQLSSFVPSPP
jgi:hypothetical protein